MFGILDNRGLFGRPKLGFGPLARDDMDQFQQMDSAQMAPQTQILQAAVPRAPILGLPQQKNTLKK